MPKPAKKKPAAKKPATKKAATTAAAAHPTAPPPDAKALQHLRDSIARNELVIIIGTGVSMALTGGKIPALSWTGLIKDGLQHGQTKGLVTPQLATLWQSMLDSGDLDSLLGAAEFVGKKLGAPQGDLYARWLEKTCKGIQPTNTAMVQAIAGLAARGIPIATLNYDHLLETITGLPTLTLAPHHRNEVGEWMRREKPGILHLHGAYNAPATCILGIRDYQTTLGDDVRDLIQRSLGSFRRLLFIGCGDTFADPNFSVLIPWLREKMGTATPQHFALVHDGEYDKRQKDSSWLGFVEPLCHGMRDDLPKFLLDFLGGMSGSGGGGNTATSTGTGSTAAPGSAPPAPPESAVPSHEVLITRYKDYLIRDCGPMTIEGMSISKMDINRERFELESLFVPLRVIARELVQESRDRQFQEDIDLFDYLDGTSFAGPRSSEVENIYPFCSSFEKHRHLALLALPGGGKSLLLRRLAVAYADPDRLAKSSDQLPALSLTPLLIRCREWRAHIHLPLPTLLRHLTDITGQSDLHGLHEALLPLAKHGKLLILVDGLDEIHDDTTRAVFVKNLKSFMDEHKENRLVVTSREAGFDLVAPTLATFCVRLRIAPLEKEAIRQLCYHWCFLMTRNRPQDIAEMDGLVRQLGEKASLQRLAENPLLLTMLLVVRHGSGGRLPPNRVRLYELATDVLLDTWNIEGHAPLDTSEAIPVLAFIAFEMMKAGKQTATETELLFMIELARRDVPKSRLYAKGSPAEFLKRVELRSSLLVHAGHQMDKGSNAPFYQFRHLTFQEYLAAVAAADGYYSGSTSQDSLLVPLHLYLLDEKWKEVIPMAAVKAKKTAQPLIAELVLQATQVADLENEEEEEDNAYNLFTPLLRTHLPGPVTMLAQCLAEEAEASPATISIALKCISRRASGGGNPVWLALARSPYGAELFHHVWQLYVNRDDYSSEMHEACNETLAAQWDLEKWTLEDQRAQSAFAWLSSTDNELVARGLFVVDYASQFKVNFDKDSPLASPLVWKDNAAVNQKIISLWRHSSPVIACTAVHIADNLRRRSQFSSEVSAADLTVLTSIWLRTRNSSVQAACQLLLLHHALSLPRQTWQPQLTAQEVTYLSERASASVEQLASIQSWKGFYYWEDGDSLDLVLPVVLTALIVAVHAGQPWDDGEILRKLATSGSQLPELYGSNHYLAGFTARMREKLATPLAL